MSTLKPVFVASDVHYGAAPPAHQEAFLDWLDHAASEASSILINGDLFDFWFEYRWGTTRGYETVLAQLRDIVDAGIPTTLMGGNHDWWGGRYLKEEIGLEFLDEPTTRPLAGLNTHIAHGDGLGAGDYGYLVLKSILRSPFTKFAFGLLPVDVGDQIAGGVSKTENRWDQWGSRQRARSDALEAWALDRMAEHRELDLILLGHTHLPLVREPEPGRWYVNTGDWVFHQSYVVLQAGSPPQLLDWRDR